MQLLDDAFPLLIGVAPRRYDAESMRQMASAFERQFQARRRYAFVSVQPPNSPSPGATERQLLMRWLQSPRVQERSAELCVASAAVLDGALMRGALTAVLWFWRPPFPLETTGTPREGIDYCLERLVAAEIPLPSSPDQLRARALARLEATLAAGR